MTGVQITWNQARAWRLRRHLLDRRSPESRDVVDIATRLCGIHAQVMSAAELAVMVRQRRPRPEPVRRALTDRRLVRVWAMRGTLHVLEPGQASAFATLLAATRSWEATDWQRRFLSENDMRSLAEAVAPLLEGRLLTRTELADEVEARTGSLIVAERVRSSWGEALKPLAWEGLICHGPPRGREVTFTSPRTWTTGWRTLHVTEAARIAIPAYLAVHGPATPAAFDGWLTGGTTERAVLRSWFHDARDLLTTVRVEGEPRLVRSADADALRDARPARFLRLLPTFDQFILGVSASDEHTVPRQHRGAVSRTGGWISPTIVTNSGVIGTWRAGRTSLDIQPFNDLRLRNPKALLREAQRTAQLLHKEPPADRLAG